MTNIAGREVKTPDLVLIVTGIVAFIASFLPWYKADVDVDKELAGLPASVRAAARAAVDDATINGWHSKFVGWGGVLLLMVVAGLVAAKVFAGFVPPRSAIGPALLLLLLSGLAVGAYLAATAMIQRGQSIRREHDDLRCLALWFL